MHIMAKPVSIKKSRISVLPLASLLLLTFSLIPLHVHASGLLPQMTELLTPSQQETTAKKWS